MTKKIFALLAATLLLAGCGAKKTSTTVTPTPEPKVVEMPLDQRPLISLTPSADGHYLTLNITGLPSTITSIEYEILYNAGENGAVIEKGVGDTLKEITSNIERKLLLGTESCTSGCKYSYDKGVTGGSVTINFIDKNGQISTFTSPFALRSTADLKASESLSLPDDSFSVPLKTKLTGSDYFVLIKNYRGGYSVYSSSKNSLVGDYQDQ